MKRVLVCVGTRPNLIKITQLEKELQAYPEIEYKLLHTGQHYDSNMSGIFFKELGVRAPDIALGVGQGTQVEVICRIMTAFEALLASYRPDLVMVPGDVNSSVACAFVASRNNIPVAHIESGLRSFDKAMPEEINRLLIDDIGELLFVTEPSGSMNLLNENKSQAAIRYVGNTMIDALIAFMPSIERASIRDRIGVGVQDYYVVTLHRAANVDSPIHLATLAGILRDLSRSRKVVFPVHPRTRRRFEEFALTSVLEAGNIIPTEPLGYLDFLSLVKGARAVITDSGGVQEETTFLRVPCITLRKSTERPVTITEGTNTLCTLDAGAIRDILESVDAGTYKTGSVPRLWDGRASERIAREVNSFLTNI